MRLRCVVGGAGTFYFGWTSFSEVSGGPTVRAGYPSLAAMVAIVSALAIVASAHFTRDQIPHPVQPSGPVVRFGPRRMLAQVADCIANRNYRVMLLVMFFVSASTGTSAYWRSIGRRILRFKPR